MEKKMRKISVLMTVYNAEKMLDKSISGILNQTYKELEFVIVNDGSTDSSDSIIEKYAKQDERIVFVNRKENKGRNYSLNEGLECCTGEWIAINDADDVSFAERLEKMSNFIDENSLADKFGVVGSASIIRDIVNNEEKKYLVKYGRVGKKKISKFRIFYSMPFIHSSFIYNKKALDQVGGFAKEVTAWIDFFTLTKISANYPVYALNECLVERYIDGNNYFLKPKMQQQTNKNEAIINQWKKEHLSNYRLYRFMKKIVDLLKKIKGSL